MTLTDRLTAALAAPATDDAFDPHAELGELLSGIGMHSGDTGGTITFRGADPVVPSTLRLGGAAALALAAKSAALAALWRRRGGGGQDITVDLRTAPHRLCPFYDRKWELLNGYPAGTPANANNALGFRFYRTADERWVMPLNPYPKIKVAAQRLLGEPGPVNRDSKGCGTVMRSAPFGLTGAGAGTACTTAARCAQLTHGHPTGGTAAGPFAALIDGLVAGAAFPTALDEVLALLTTLAGADETIAALSRAVSLPTERATPPSTTATGIGPANAIHSTRPNDSEHMTSTITETSTKSLARSHPAAIT